MARRRNRKRNRERAAVPQGLTYEKFAFGAMIVVGAVLLCVGVVSTLIPAWQATFHLAEHRCLVLETQVTAAKKPAGVYRPEVKVRYEVNGQIFQTWTYDSSMVYHGGKEMNAERLKPFVVGKECPCWYNEEDPTRVVVVRAFPFSILLLLLIPCAAIAAGVFGLWTQRQAVSLPPAEEATGGAADRGNNSR